MTTMLNFLLFFTSTLLAVKSAHLVVEGEGLMDNTVHVEFHSQDVSTTDSALLRRNASHLSELVARDVAGKFASSGETSDEQSTADLTSTSVQKRKSSPSGSWSTASHPNEFEPGTTEDVGKLSSGADAKTVPVDVAGRFLKRSSESPAPTPSGNWSSEVQDAGNVITANIRNHMQKGDDVSIHCMGLKDGTVVRVFRVVWLSPDQDHTWTMTVSDGETAPNRLACVFTWADKQISSILYQSTPHSEVNPNSLWQVDEMGLYYNVLSFGYLLVRTWVHVSK